MIPEITVKLLKAKREKGLTFAELGQLIGQSEVFTAAVFYRQATATADQVQQLSKALELPESELVELMIYPVKGLGSTVPTDPLIYRFYEIIQVYGLPLKDVIQEKFGDGIMSAIDFTLDVEKIEDPAGARVKVIMNGKFLPYKKW
ncbi:cyanase [Thermosynechococcus sichuanensis E542]|uniref:Cyanate hydratase n=1 Tax=Thermosynechococcus sichuanensis E542 TaxID=2016101 RepID=A0A3B7MGL1_9CYAN|nr:cyanase [Thermosynechococcus vestitus]AXY68594.1 cyanase [Thermosynechococcus vestitus E542]